MEAWLRKTTHERQSVMAIILCVGDEQSVDLILQNTLGRAGHRLLLARNVTEALQLLATDRVDQIETAIPSTEADPELVRLRRENEALRREVTAYRSERQIVGDSTAIRRVLQFVAMAAPACDPVLFTGESGTGKELFARALHDQSNRRGKPFVQLNCAALPDGLVESALFGQRKAALASGAKDVPGTLDRAGGGTLLIDEIAEMPLDVQARLLTVLQEQTSERVGGTARQEADVRVIATTSRDLVMEVDAGRFRQDLYDVLSIIRIALPPLRDRTNDIPALSTRFATSAARSIGKEITSISPDAMAILQAYEWPGNVRELQHAIERAVVLSTSPSLAAHAFEQLRGTHPPPSTRGSGPFAELISGGTRAAAATSRSSSQDKGVRLPTLNMHEAERLLIREALERTSNNRTRAAKLLGMSVRTLRSKLNGPNGARAEALAGDIPADD